MTSRICVDVLMDHGWSRGHSCHMFHLDNDKEALCLFAESIGMKRSWCQTGSRPHFDLVKSKRELAVKRGAREVTRRDEDYVTWVRNGRPLPPQVTEGGAK